MVAIDAAMTAGASVLWEVHHDTGDVLLPVARADEWGAWLEVLIAAIHHPAALAEQQPDTDAGEVATWVLEDLDELEAAARAAEAHAGAARRAPTVGVRLHDDREMVVISPGAELVNLVGMLRTFARAVLTPGGPEHRDAAGVTGYVAAAWTRQLAAATGAL